ncbi:DUF421 domain-containing protein [Mangrovibacillus cuniculi]|uniref:DUF421 domain-containing protein n=1 Tax=Mangrovibacillus cuniculi TaxID=2593652 RepID=A0A7S8HFJ1_9BACI|nr:DUF421 domain-containing protein [Mangrovibacillus cuniculi]QPC46490.1 DUF421 domain-containing protein [Mangrovibacillus cuniculi]
MSIILHISAVLITGFFALLISTKILGKTQISQLTAFDFISAIVLGELVGNGIFDPDVTIWSILYAIVVWTVLVYGVLYITQKFRHTRSFLEGNPSILIRNGIIDKEQLVKNKLDINELLQMLRTEKDIFSIREVEFAILEPNGKISALKKYPYDTPTTSEFQMTAKAVYLPISLISDGVVDLDNLEQSGFTESWLMNQIQQYGLTNFEDVLYGEWREDDGFFCLPTQNKTK